MKGIRFVLSLVLVFGVAASAAAQQSVFLVRHAEKAAPAAGATPALAADTDLSPAGRARAETLAAMLKDAGITAIVVTQYKRTQQTAVPLAKALGVTVVEVHSDDIKGQVERITAASGNVLLIGHTGSVPKVLSALGVDAPTIPETEYDNLFVVTRGAKSSAVRLRFK